MAGQSLLGQSGSGSDQGEEDVVVPGGAREFAAQGVMCGFAAGAVAGEAAPQGEGCGAVGLAGALSVRVHGHVAPPGAAVCEGPLGARGGRAARGGARRAHAGGAGVGCRALCGCASGRDLAAGGPPRPGVARAQPGELVATRGAARRDAPGSPVHRLPGVAGVRRGGSSQIKPARLLPAARSALERPPLGPAPGGPGRGGRPLGGHGVRRHAPALERPPLPPRRPRRRHAAATCRQGRPPRRPAPPPRPPDAAAPAASWRDPGWSTGPQPQRGSDCRLSAQETAPHPRLGPPEPLHVRASFPAAQGRKPRNQPQLGPQWRGAVRRRGSAPPAHTHAHSSISLLHSPETQAGV